MMNKWFDNLLLAAVPIAIVGYPLVYAYGVSDAIVVSIGFYSLLVLVFSKINNIILSVGDKYALSNASDSMHFLPALMLVLAPIGVVVEPWFGIAMMAYAVVILPTGTQAIKFAYNGFIDSCAKLHCSASLVKNEVGSFYTIVVVLTAVFSFCSAVVYETSNDKSPLLWLVMACYCLVTTFWCWYIAKWKISRIKSHPLTFY